MTDRPSPTTLLAGTPAVTVRSTLSPQDARLILAGILLVGAGLRLLLLDRWGVRLDEVFTWWAATRPVDQLAGTLAAVDTHPPLFYALEHLWLRLGDGVVWARLPAAVLGLAVVPVAHRIGVRVAGRRIGLVAAAFVALSPWHLWHAQDARGYTLLSLAVAVSLLGAVEVLDGDGGWRPHLLHGAGGIVAVLTHNVGIVLIGAIAVATTVALRRAERPRRLRWLLASGAVVAVWALWLPWLLRQIGHVDQNLAWVSREVDWIGVLGAPFGAWAGAPPAPGSRAWWAIGLTVWLLVAAWRALEGRRGLRALLLAGVFVLPVVEAASLAVSPAFVTRSLLPTSVPLFVLLAVALASLRGRRRSVALAAMAVVVLAAAIRLGGPAADPWEEVTDVLAGQAGPDDTVVYVMNVGELATDWLGGVPGVPHPIPGPFAERLVWDEVVTRDAVARAAATVPRTSVVWLVYSHPDRMDPEGLVARWLDRSRPLDLRVVAGGVELRRYDAVSSSDVPEAAAWTSARRALRAAYQRPANASSSAPPSSTSE